MPGFIPGHEGENLCHHRISFLQIIEAISNISSHTQEEKAMKIKNFFKIVLHYKFG